MADAVQTAAADVSQAAPVCLGLVATCDAAAPHLLGLARAPTLLKARLDQARRPSSFCRYAYPQDPSRSFPVR